MTIYRGPGGTGSATSDADTTLYQDFLNQTIAARDAALQAETNAELAETNAETAEANAASSASAAATSASNASTSATNAASSASAASTSASNAASSASSASSSASAASTSATNAASSATAAAASASAASTSETNAASSASAAATSATNAANSASSASTSASNAAASESAAASSASAAATSETNAASSASAAASSASSAATSAANAAAVYDQFDDRYLGSKSTAPTLDNDGNALVTGALYYDTTEGAMYVYDGSQWIAASSASQAILTVYNYTATGGQTTFSGTDDNAATLAYVAGSIIVTVNGVFLENGTDYTATNGTSIVLASGAVAGDELNVYSFNTFDVANVQAIGDDRYVRLTTDQTVAGTKTLSSNPILSGGTANGVAYLNGSKVLTSGSALTFDGTNLGFGGTAQRITGDFSNATIANRVMFQTSTTDSPTTLGVLPNGTSVISALSAFASSDPTNTSSMRLLATSIDGRLDANRTGTGTYLPMTFYTNGSERMRLDTSGNLGIGTSSPGARLRVIGAASTTAARLEGASGANITVDYAGVGDNYFDAGNNIFRSAAGTERARIDSSGNLSIGSAGAASPTTVGQYTSGNNAIRYAWYQAGIAEMWIGQKANVGALCFGSGGGTSTELMRLDTNGNLIIAGTTASGKLQIYQTVSGAWAQHMVAYDYAKATVLTSAYGYGDYFVTSSGYAGAISLSGNTASYLSGSDYRLKNTIVPMTGALAKVAALKPCTWKWKSDGSDGEGFIAHELAEVCPQAVSGEKDAVDADGKPVYQGVDTSFLVATLTAAIQELKAEMDALKAELNTLKGI